MNLSCSHCCQEEIFGLKVMLGTSQCLKCHEDLPVPFITLQYFTRHSKAANLVAAVLDIATLNPFLKSQKYWKPIAIEI